LKPYSLEPSLSSSNSASIVETMPGVFSVLVGDRSFLVNVGPGPEGELEVWTSGDERHAISLADPRDRASRSAKASGDGPVEVRAQMPGKVIQVLVEPGAAVEAGQGLVVVEAMKMQNEMKAPKSGRVARVHAREGATVIAGEPLAVVE
jgi:biotin carboxyl carrier protein